MELQRFWLAAALLGAVGLGCSRPAVTTTSDAGQGRATSSPARAGVKVPLPEGWRADIGVDQSFVAGPPGRAVLRVDLRPGAAASFPTADELQKSFSDALKNARVQREDTTTEADFVAVRLDVFSHFDGGTEHPHDVLLGARKIGGDLFLCSSAPGANEAELDLALKACRDLEWTTAQ
ncbi:MAG: hypothetical protein ACJ790_17590 [Myxococcaceae bacterium]